MGERNQTQRLYFRKIRDPALSQHDDFSDLRKVKEFRKWRTSLPRVSEEM